MEQQGIYERLKEQVSHLKAESRDRYFTEYLVKFDGRLIQEKHQLDLMEAELERSCCLYQQRMASADAPTPQHMASADAPTPQRMASADASTPQRMVSEDASTPRTEMSQNQDTYSTGSIPTQNPAFQPNISSQAVQKSRKNHEFTVGIGVFATIGILFVLAALILLGINYMNTMVKEIGLYAVGLLVWGVAEFGLKKRNQTLSMIFASLGIGSLYVTTMVNFLYWGNFSGLVTILITTFITVVVMFVSRKKDAGILRIICIGACMISFLMMDTLHMTSDVELLIYMGMILLVQLLGIFLPVKKWAYGIALGQIAGAALFTWILSIGTVSPETVMEIRSLYLIGFIVLSMLMMELIVWKMPTESEGQQHGIFVTFGISAGLLIWSYQWCAIGSFDWCNGPYSDIEIWIRIGVMAVIAAMAVVFFFLTKNRGNLCWMQGYLVCGAALLLFACETDMRLYVTIALTVLMILYKLLAYRFRQMHVAGAVVTVWTALAALIYHDSLYGYVLLCVLLLSILLMNHWQTFYELLITGSLVLYIPLVLDNDLVLPLMIAVMWLSELLFNYVKRLAGRRIAGFNYTVLVAEILCYLALIFKSYESPVFYIILTVLGLGIILFTFKPRFHMAVNWRGLAISGFLTYMVLVARFEYGIVSSILMMIVGLVSIALGFRQEDKKLRIYGLVLCLLTCFKITLFDFRVQDLQRIILFLTVGVLALVISGIYALMEKKYSKMGDES